MIEQASLVIGNDNFAVKENSFLGYAINQGFYVPREMDVVRATTATLVNSEGLIEPVAYNLLQQSQTFENAYWVKANTTVASNATTAPNGTLTADLILNTVAGGYINNTSFVGLVGIVYSYSFYIKNNNSTSTLILVRESSNALSATINWSGSNISSITNTTGTSTFTALDNGWFRISGTYTSTESGQQLRIYPQSGSGTNSVYIWGAQLVTGSTPKTYFPTTDRLDIPRVDYSNGTPSILVEPQRTNLATYSEDFSNAIWTKVTTTITTNSTTAPNGTLTADTFAGDGTSNVKVITGGFAVVSGTTYSMSVFAKKNTNNFIQLLASSSTFGANVWANFDLNNGVIGSVGTSSTARIENYGNGWYRCTIVGTVTASTTPAFSVGLITSATSARAEVNTLSTSVYIWGAQLEAGSYATSYIPTIASSVTRNADVISKTGISSLIGQTEGTMFFDGIVNNIQSAYSNILNTNKNLSLSTIQLSKLKSNNKFRFEQFLGNGTTSSIILNSTNAFANGTRTKIAIRYKSGSFAMYINGNLEATSSSSFTNIGTKTELFLNDAVTFFNYQESVSFNSVVLFTSGLTNEQLAQLTTI